jgi:hypothetical protein
MADELWGWEFRVQIPQQDLPTTETPEPGLLPVEVPVPPGPDAVVPRWPAEVAAGSSLFAGRRAEGSHRAWLEQVVAGQEAVAAAMGEWVAGRPAAEVARAGWWPVAPTGSGRVDVYGGSGDGWAALLATAAGSLLAGGASVTVVDLSGESVSRRLVARAGTAGQRIDLLTLPDHLPDVHLLADLTADQAGEVIAEAVHAVDRDSGTGDRARDAGLLGQVIRCLREPVEFGRLHAALRALRGGPIIELLDRTEQANLAALVPASTGTLPVARLRRLTAAVHELVLLSEHEVEIRPYRDPAAQLRVMQLADPESGQPTELLRQLVFGVLVHQVRRQVPTAGPARLLIVAGADELRRSHVERLERLAHRRGIRLVLLFRRLRPELSATTSDADATLLMRPATAAEADRAAAVTGEHHHFLTPARPEKPAQPGRSGQSVPPDPYHPVPVVLAVPPVAAPAATPAFLRGLPETAFVLLDPHDPGSPRLADCDPPVAHDTDPRQVTGATVPAIPLWAAGDAAPEEA